MIVVLRATNGRRKMQLNEYQQKAKETAVYPEQIGLEYTILGLCGEAGELANQYKKVLRDDGGKINRERWEKLIDESGDVLWYLAMVAGELGVTLSYIANKNLQKLTARKAAKTLQGSGDNR